MQKPQVGLHGRPQVHGGEERARHAHADHRQRVGDGEQSLPARHDASLEHAEDAGEHHELARPDEEGFARRAPIRHAPAGLVHPAHAHMVAPEEVHDGGQKRQHEKHPHGQLARKVAREIAQKRADEGGGREIATREVHRRLGVKAQPQEHEYGLARADEGNGDDPEDKRRRLGGERAADEQLQRLVPACRAKTFENPAEHDEEHAERGVQNELSLEEVLGQQTLIGYHQRKKEQEKVPTHEDAEAEKTKRDRREVGRPPAVLVCVMGRFRLLLRTLVLLRTGARPTFVTPCAPHAESGQPRSFAPLRPTCPINLMGSDPRLSR